jgi:flagellar basal-body rod protein FlgG
MLQGMHAAAAGMAAQQGRIDALSNDLANVSTTGYKRARVGFRDLVYAASGAGSGAAVASLGRGLAQGALRRTDAPLDVAIQGQGYLQVRRADGSPALTRDGALHADAQGRLVTSSGEQLQPAIALPAGTDAADVKIAGDGTVTAGGRRIGRIEIVDVPAPQGLQPLGGSLFAVTAASGPARAAAGATIEQGALESANVDMADAMVELMDAQRSFQLASRAIQVQDQMMEIANGVKRG